MIIFGPPEKIDNFIPSISTIVDFFPRFSTFQGYPWFSGISGVNPPKWEKAVWHPSAAVSDAQAAADTWQEWSIHQSNPI
jgi:hypothetical protein